jgi:arginyl-tRNA synthetase
MPLQTPRDALHDTLRDAFCRVTGFDDVDPLVSPCGNKTMGDYQSNAAMSLAGRIKKERGDKANPRQIATDVADLLSDLEMLAEKPKIAGPGFINFRLSPTWVAQQASEALSDNRLGVPRDEPTQTVVVEYSSPNIAKQMHVGHIRSTILGDAAARVLEFLGHHVIRQNHVGDWGTQFGMLIARLNEAGGPTAAATAPIGDLEDFYRQAKRRFDEDEAFKTQARETVVRLQSGESAERDAWQRLVDETRKDYLPTYDRLNVQLGVDDERGESFYNDRLPSLARDLEDAGVAAVSDGALVSFAGDFKSPLMIRKTDGGYCYGTTDLAAVEYRATELKADRVLYFVDARQAQHFKQVFATAKVAAEKIPDWQPVGDVSFEHASFGSVLGEGGTPLKTRDGGTIKLVDLLDEAERRARIVVEEASPDLPADEKDALAKAVGIGAVKYADLSKDRASDYVFSFDEMLRLDGNSGPYMQYAHARVRSVLRKAESAGGGTISTLDAPEEVALAKQLLLFGDAVQQVALDLRPHVLCAYLYDTARAFSRFYDACPILKSEGAIRESRLALADLTGRTIAQGLDLLGIDHPERM